MKGLTDKQQEILDFISDFSKREGMAPTISEISGNFNIKAATAFAHVRALQHKGFVRRSSKARSLALAQTRHPRNFSLSLKIPLLGSISAGVPFLAEEHVERHLMLDSSMLPRQMAREKLFALRVFGESMRDLGILNGDIIIARQTAQAKEKDVVVAMVDGETTVKSLYRDGDMWELRPANPDFQSRYVPMDELEIQGVLVTLIRVY